MDHPLHDEDPYNDDEEGDETREFRDSDLDPEAYGDYSFEIQSLKDAGRGHLT